MNIHLDFKLKVGNIHILLFTGGIYRKREEERKTHKAVAALSLTRGVQVNKRLS